MIRVIKGTIGYWDGRKVVPYTAAHGNIQLDAASEERFVKLGVAEYVGEYDATADDVDGNDLNSPAYSVDMKSADLRKIGAEFGLKFPANMSKAAMVAALDEHFAAIPADDEETDTEDEESGEDAPTFDSTEAVR